MLIQFSSKLTNGKTKLDFRFGGQPVQKTETPKFKASTSTSVVIMLEYGLLLLKRAYQNG